MSALEKINHFVVLMLENRSFDHVLGYLRKTNPSVAGMPDSAFNFEDPVGKVSKVQVSRASTMALPFDPSHEFPEVQVQLYGPGQGVGTTPAMSGFICSSVSAGGPRARQVMECFQPDQLPVLTALARAYGIVNYWYSPMPGPTWPNRFFVHAGTCGGLTESPGKRASMLGFQFKAGTIFDRLGAAGLNWRVYHTDIPQVLGIRSIRKHFLGRTHFRKFDEFDADVANGDLPAYTFIEPHYDVFNDFVEGDSMHPHNDVAQGERLIKQVYEALRNSRLWDDTMLIITFDEHGGFYDHVAPPTTLPTGDDTRYATKRHGFKFDRYGVRVPAIVVSAFTAAGTVVGASPGARSTTFDHSSIPATLEKRFGLAALTKRDAMANTLEAFVNLDVARDRDAPERLPAAKSVRRATGALRARRLGVAATRRAPLTKQQDAFLGLVMAVDAQTRPGVGRAVTIAALAPRTRGAADAYARRVQARVMANRARNRVLV